MKLFKAKKTGFFIALVFLVFLVIPTKRNIAKAYVCIDKDVNAACQDIQAANMEQANSVCNVDTQVPVKGKCGVPATPVSPHYSCVSRDGFCRDLDPTIIDTLEKANVACGAGENNAITGNTAISRECPTEPEPVEPMFSTTTVTWGCIKDGVCTDLTIKESEKSEFEKKCIAWCGGNKKTCVSTAFPCPPLKGFACYSKLGSDVTCSDIQADSFDAAKNLCTNSCKKDRTCEADVKECPPAGPLAGTSAEELQKQALAQLNPGHISKPEVLISRAINLMTAFIGSIALLLYVVSGFLWMTASGASEQVDRAKKIMVWTTLGVVVMLGSYMLVSALFDFIPK